MKRKICNVISLGIFIGILLIVSTGFAATVGNPSSTTLPRGGGVFSLKQDQNLSIKMGMEADILLDRDIHASAGTDAELTSGEWYMAKISYGFFNNRIEPYIKLGVAHLKAKWKEGGIEVKLESDTDFAWGLGTKVLIWDFKQPKIKLVGDGVYRLAELNGESGYLNGTKPTLNTAQSKFVIREWQAALLATTEIDVGGGTVDSMLGISALAPYIGVKYSDISGRLRLTQSTGAFFNPGEIESDNNFGIFVGCDILGTESVLLNLEGRFIEETAMTGGLVFLF